MRPRVFPAEDAAYIDMGYHSSLSFNEAAGIPRGRRAEIRRSLMVNAHASMRPRVFPAEDRDDRSDRLNCSSASMRPRVFPAEDELIDVIDNLRSTRLQ